MSQKKLIAGGIDDDDNINVTDESYLEMENVEER
jgi:hypothetical protein